MSVEKEIERLVVLLNNIVSSKIENENMALNKNYLEQFVALFPERQAEIERFNSLQEADSNPRVAVFGKFNHGKSTLLNALIDHEGYFKASDKRETRSNSQFKDEKNGIIWLDTPGLDADVTGKDDFAANRGAIVDSDIILMVHTLNAADLDKYEIEHINRLLTEAKGASKILVLTQVDQVDEDNQARALKRIKEQIKEEFKDQLLEFEPVLVSSIYYSMGVEQSQNELIKLSGIPELRNKIKDLTSDVLSQREKEIEQLRNMLDSLLNERETEIKRRLSNLAQAHKTKRQNFERQLNKIFNSL